MVIYQYMVNGFFTLSRKRISHNLIVCVLLLSIILSSCSQYDDLKPITVKQFANFVEQTGYVTDAEKFGWSIVQKTVFNYEIVEGATWKTPNGKDKAKSLLPVTQVSYNDAIAYCKWANVQLPSYNDYWKLAQNDTRTIIKNSDYIRVVSDVNIIGNTWDITTSKNAKGDIRLAGGSYLCNDYTCNGTNVDRVLYVSADTGNSHISFSVY